MSGGGLSNLLPRFESFQLDESADSKGRERTTKPNHLTWVPQLSVPSDSIPIGLECDITKEEVVTQRAVEEKLPLPAPNQRYVGRDEMKSVADPSPLGIQERGKQAVATISAPPEKSIVKDSFKVYNKPVSYENLYLRLFNFLPYPVDLYIQKPSAISAVTLSPFRECIKLVSGNPLPSTSPVPAKLCAAILLATSAQILVTLTGRQEIQDFTFSPGPIGMEVECYHGRLVCTKVLENSQASNFQSALDGAEIIAVDGNRVNSLEGFQNCVMMGQKNGSVRIQAASYFGTRQKGDDMFLRNLGASKTTVKSLLSGILKTGIDNDHSHGLELPGAAGESEEDEDDESNVSPDAKDSSPSGKEEKKDSKDFKEMDKQEKNEEVGGGGGEEGDEGEEDEEHKLAQKDHRDDSSSSDESDADESHIQRRTRTKKPSTLAMDAEEEEALLAPSKSTSRFESQAPVEDKYSISYDAQDGKDEKDADDGVLDDDAAGEQDDQDLMSVGPQASQGSDEESVHEAVVWDYATSLEHASKSPFTRTVCVPNLFMRSSSWGQPTKYLQFSNFSSAFDIHVYWVDEESALVPRIIVRPGVRHIELVSPEHAWIAVAVKHDSNSVAEEPGLLVDISTKVAVLVLRPSLASIADNKCTTILWVPWSSISAKQGAHPAQIPKHKITPGRTAQDVLLPHFHLQLLNPGNSDHMKAGSK